MMKLLMSILMSLISGMDRLLGPATVAHAAHGGDPDTADAFCFQRAINNLAFIAGGVATIDKNGIIYTAPKTTGRQVRLRSVCVAAYVVAIDATDDITIVLKTITAAGVAKATLNTAVSIKSTNLTNLNSLEIWNGSAILLPGESLLFEMTSVSPDTAGYGYALSVDGDVQKV